MSARVFSLLVKHRRLDDAIRFEQDRRWPDVPRIQKLKKLKLAVKDRLHLLATRRRPARAG